MIIVRLVGGLANQMYPYAAGRRLAHSLNQELKLDISPFDDYRNQSAQERRTYTLGVFNIAAAIATAAEIDSASMRDWSPLRYWGDRLLGKSQRQLYRYKEKHFHFDSQVMRLQGNIYLAGNWCSYRYFADIADLIARDFTMRNPLSATAYELSKQIHASDSVSIHIRRGDYATNPKINAIYGTCDLDYYTRCITGLTQKKTNPYFFVFSDDPEWVKTNYKISFPHTILDKSLDIPDHEHMWLMSQCRSNIIANSGFSWWAAWLNSHPDKLVYAPRQWFRSGKYRTHTLIPDEWIQL